MYRKAVTLLAVGLVLAIAGGVAAQDSVLFEYFDNIGGVSVDDNLRPDCTFPDGPSESVYLDRFASPDGRADNYGVRGRAYLTVAEDGDYTFWVSGDDNCQLWLSSDDTAANAVMIAQVPGWTPVEAWDWYAEQESAPVALVAGQSYYIEALMKEGGGGDSLEVGWSGPGIEGPVVIEGDYLTGYVRTSFPAYCPDPADGAIDIVTPLFKWSPGVGAVMHDIYFGTDPAALVLKTTMPSPLYFHLEPLVPGQTYYWRVDETNAEGAKSEGHVWSFTVMNVKATEPSPPDGAANAPLDAQLSWKAGRDAATHDVYFGTDEAAVAARDASVAQGSVDVASVDPGPLDAETTYYWLVDETDAAGAKHEGDVWSFSTAPVIEPVDEPCLIGWWTFDTEPANTMTALDMSGNGHHGTLVGNVSIAGGVLNLPGGSNQFVQIGSVGISGTMPRTIACWAKADHTNIPDWSLIFGFTTMGGGCGSHFNIGSIGGPGGCGAHAWCWEETIFSDTDALEWHHYAMTYDGTTIEYYGDGMPMDTDPAKSNVQDLSIMADNVHIGSRITQDSSFPGQVDDCRIYDCVLTAAQIRELGSDVLQAWDPQPADGATVDFGTVIALIWQPGDEAVAHDVYVGTDADLVAAGDASVYQGQVDVPSYAPLEDFAGDKTHYWRIDEINADETVTPGPVWSFSVRPEVLTSPEAWESVAAAGAPGFLATDVENGTYDIGTFSGDQTYEFIVQSNPDEQEASMALIGRLNFGDTRVGLKYEQWNNTGTYGATQFGVADHDYGVANNPGVPTHLVFVSDDALATTTLYVDGVARGSIPAAIPLSGTVGIGRAIREDGTWVDNFDGEIFGVAIYDRALSAGEIRVHADAYLLRGRADITAPGDTVIGVPDDGDWPGAEYPALAIDDNTGTKYLHFKGETEPTGFKVEPALGPTIVTGMTFTTANDAAERDPIMYELYGSNESIDGPYELIASGDIVDFAAAEAAPRFTMNATPIEFENSTAYMYYQVMIPAVRDPGSANSMQVAEVELIGVPEFVLFADDFESYAVGSDLHGQGGWKGWNNDAGAGAPASDAFASSGSVSVELIGSADLVHEFDIAGGTWKLSAMQYIPSGTAGETWFILMNSYDDGANQDWSVDYKFNLDTGVLTSDETGATATIVYDQWVAVEFVIDLDANTVDGYYNGDLVASHEWDNDNHGTIGAIDLWANGASSVYYDDVTIARH